TERSTSASAGRTRSTAASNDVPASGTALADASARFGLESAREPVAPSAGSGDELPGGDDPSATEFAGASPDDAPSLAREPSTLASMSTSGTETLIPPPHAARAEALIANLAKRTMHARKATQLFGILPT